MTRKEKIKAQIKEQGAKFLFFLSLLIIGSSIIAWLDIQELLISLQEWIAQTGPIAPLVFIAVYALFTTFFLPVLQLNIIAGIVFGGVWGSLYVTIGSWIGACTAFWIARDYGYKLVRKFLSQYIDKLHKCEKMIEKNGFVAVLILRLVPVFPYSGLSFFLGLTSVRFRDFFWGTAIGNIPWTVAYVYFGNSIKEQSAIQAFGAISAILLGMLAVKMYRDMSNE